ncbi:MrcB family domain-containing protein [Chloroflexota bacterium]
MKQTFLEIMRGYNTARQQPLTDHALAKYINKDAPKQLIEEAAISTAQYSVQGGSGKGNWAEIPWIGVFDRQITTSAQKGYYIVYLFKAEMTGVYLSLNMGWTQFENKFKSLKEARANIRDTAVVCKKLLRSSLSDFSYDPINLATKRTLGVGYQLGHICGRFYPREDIPDDNLLINDLRNLIGVYRELKGYLGTTDITSLHLMQQDTEEAEEHIEDVKYQLEIQKAKPVYNISLIPQQKPEYNELGGRKQWKKNASIAKTCIMRADYKCELDPTHHTFTCQQTSKNYVEAHHLIPMSFQELFSYSLDVPANIVSLCPTCHRLVHHATFGQKGKCLQSLFETRKTELEQCGIRLSYGQLIELYEK